MKLALLREYLATEIALVVPDDVSVIASVPDSIAPPCVIVSWGEPWLLPSTHCLFVASLDVICIAARIEPGLQLGVLEDLVSAIVPSFKGMGMAVGSVSSPFPLTLGGVDYLSASINVIQEVEE